MTLSFAASAQNANGAKPKKTSTVTTAEKPASGNTPEATLTADVDPQGNKKGTPEYEEARKAERMNAEEKKKSTLQ